MKKHPPEYIMRFYGTIDYALEVLAQKQIAFVHADKLNDPFDPYFFFETDFGESHAELLKYIHKNHTSDLPWFVNHVPITSWSDATKDVKARLKEWRKKAYVLSMCTERNGLHPKDNLYMWGHYGNGHRGIAIEFDSAALTQNVIEQNRKEKGADVAVDQVWTEIQYADQLSPLDCEIFFEFFKEGHEWSKNKKQPVPKTRLDQYYNLMGQIKSTAWKQEHEWRLMWQGEETEVGVYKCPIGNDAIKVIYMGLNVEEVTKERIIAVAKSNFPQAKIYKAKKRHGDLALDFEFINP